MKIRLFFTYLLSGAALLLGTANAHGQQTSQTETAFGDGEKLTFVISYRAAMVPNTEVAEVVFRTSSTDFEGTPAYHIHASATVYPFYKWFYDLHDTYESWISKDGLRPLRHSFRVREGKHRANADFRYDWNNNTVTTQYRNLRKEQGRTTTMPLTNHSYDAIALFFNLRNDNIENYTAGANRTLEIVLDDTIRKVNYKYLGKEANKNIRGLGRFNTLKFSCQLATSDGESFEDGSEFFLWISDDKNKIPLYIESPIKVGSIRGRLSKYEGLSHPLDSKR